MARYRGKYILDGLDEIPEDMMYHLDLSYEICRKLSELAECECCGKCCHQPYITVMDDEVVRISDHLEMNPYDFVTKYLQRVDDRWLFSKSTDGPCAFLGKDNRCTIWSERPEICRDFPYMVSKLMSIVFLHIVHGVDMDLSYMDDSWPCTAVIKSSIRDVVVETIRNRPSPL